MERKTCPRIGRLETVSGTRLPSAHGSHRVIILQKQYLITAPLFQFITTRSVVITTLAHTPSTTVYSSSHPRHDITRLDTVSKTVIGATVGSASLLLIIIIFFVWLRRQRRKKSATREKTRRQNSSLEQAHHHQHPSQFSTMEEDQTITDRTNPGLHIAELEQPQNNIITELEKPEQRVELPERGIWQERSELPTAANAIELDVFPQRWEEEEEDDSTG